MIKYEGTRVYTNPYRQTEKEFDTLEEAVAYAEESGIGKVITWHVGPNLPGCLPELKYSSCALRVFEDGKWREVNIHG